MNPLPILYNYIPYATPRSGIFSCEKENGSYTIANGWEKEEVECLIIGEDNTSYIYQLKETGHGEWVGNQVIEQRYILPIGIHKSRLLKWTDNQLTLF